MLKLSGKIRIATEAEEASMREDIDEVCTPSLELITSIVEEIALASAGEIAVDVYRLPHIRMWMIRRRVSASANEIATYRRPKRFIMSMEGITRACVTSVILQRRIFT
jgi:hypothetical protein